MAAIGNNGQSVSKTPLTDKGQPAAVQCGGAGSATTWLGYSLDVSLQGSTPIVAVCLRSNVWLVWLSFSGHVQFWHGQSTQYRRVKVGLPVFPNKQGGFAEQLRSAGLQASFVTAANLCDPAFARTVAARVRTWGRVIGSQRANNDNPPKIMRGTSKSLQLAVTAVGSPSEHARSFN